ncbi:sterol desaturase family protein [Ferrimonas lipolytica]|uniref:Sterol desaturase family protein n=1 Tax=Ferrimonas lipolytica TaxID=2724191 RepID=A0A6H1UDA9_9GAMM|nr:sterol desaturase family protein [Ferrimonas lipolytica]QIZ77061.1 sterol desaturase family protein [Ferrimonas lipolytica]
MPIEYIQLALGPIFISFIAFEYWRHKERYLGRDTFNNVVLAVTFQVAEILSLLAILPLFYWLYQFRWFEIELTPLNLLLAFVVQDFLYYWFHRCSHRVHWLWCAHVVHHSSALMNFSTAFRQSLLYPVAGMWLFWLPLVWLGYDPKLVLAVVGLNLGYQFFVHTKWTGKLPIFQWWFNTPSHHRVHHGRNPIYIDKNYAGVLMIWDRMFGTFQAELKHEPVRFGVIGFMETKRWTVMVIHQWRYMFQQLRRVDGAKAKLKVLFGPPTHQSCRR